MEKSLKAVREQKVEIRAAINSMIEHQKSVQVPFTDEELRKIEELGTKEADLEAIEKTLEVQEKYSKPVEQNEVENRWLQYSKYENKVTKEDVNNAIRGISLQNTPDFKAEYRHAAEKTGIAFGDNISFERRDQSVGTNSEGGYATNSFLLGGIEIGKKAYGGAFQYADVQTTNTGVPMRILTNNDVANQGGVVSELGDFTDTAFTFGDVTLNSYMYRTAVFPVSIEALQDVVGIDLGSYIMNNLETRLNRAIAKDATTGNGSNKCKGFMADAVLGVTTASSTAFTGSEIFDLIYSLDPEYQNSPNFALKMHSKTYGAIRKLVATTGSFLFGDGLNAAGKLSVAGYPVVICNDMASVADGAGNKIIAAGDWQAFKIRLVGGMNVQVLRELYLGQGAIGYVGYQRADSRLVNPGTDPIKYLALHASGTG